MARIALGKRKYKRIESKHPLANVIPRGDRVLVRRDLRQEVTPGGIALPSSAQDKQQFGTVVRVGPGRMLDNGERVPVDLQEGDRVLLNSWAGLEINDPVHARDEKDEFVLLRDEDITALDMPRD